MKGGHDGARVEGAEAWRVGAERGRGTIFCVCVRRYVTCAHVLAEGKQTNKKKTTCQCRCLYLVSFLLTSGVPQRTSTCTTFPAVGEGGHPIMFLVLSHPRHTHSRLPPPSPSLFRRSLSYVAPLSVCKHGETESFFLACVCLCMRRILPARFCVCLCSSARGYLVTSHIVSGERRGCVSCSKCSSACVYACCLPSDPTFMVLPISSLCLCVSRAYRRSLPGVGVCVE